LRHYSTTIAVQAAQAAQVMGEGFDCELWAISDQDTVSFAIFRLKEYNSCTATVVKALLEALCQ
jgi:hypothetical protein